MRRRILPAVMLATLLGVGCGGGGASESGERHVAPPAGTTPAAKLCSRLGSRVTGRVSSAAGSELSGLALSRSQPRVLWAVNDSGDRARVLALSPTGGLLADVAVPGAENVDWEGVGVGPGATLYIGDIGDNAAVRSTVVVYRVPEPRVSGGAPGAARPARRLELRYPDGAHDAEALLVDPKTGALAIVTKDYTGKGGVYVGEEPAGGAVTAMRRAGTVSLGAGGAVTAGDVSADGRTVVLRTYDQAFAWSRRRGEALGSTLGRRPCVAGADLLGEGQGETLALDLEGRAFYTVPEGSRPRLRRYAPAG